ncbi:MAG: hypothetical protein HGB23_02645 [Chlorobiaceae bacterium]|nr:hypothetical protein [Chlorobiaceae bacterium]
MKEHEDQQPAGEVVSAVKDEELQQLLRLKCVYYGGVDNITKTLTLVNRCDQCMVATIYWTPWHGESFTRTYNVPKLSAIKIALEAESSSLIAENPC